MEKNAWAFTYTLCIWLRNREYFAFLVEHQHRVPSHWVTAARWKYGWRSDRILRRCMASTTASIGIAMSEGQSVVFQLPPHTIWDYWISLNLLFQNILTLFFFNFYPTQAHAASIILDLINHSRWTRDLLNHSQWTSWHLSVVRLCLTGLTSDFMHYYTPRYFITWFSEFFIVLLHLFFSS